MTGTLIAVRTSLVQQYMSQYRYVAKFKSLGQWYILRVRNEVVIRWAKNNPADAYILPPFWRRFGRFPTRLQNFLSNFGTFAPEDTFGDVMVVLTNNQDFGAE